MTARSNKPAATITAGILLATCVAFAPRAEAGSIGFRTDAEVKSGPGLDAKVTMTHTGDEAANDVSVLAEINDRALEGEKVASIAPGQNHVWNFHLYDEIPRGVYAITLRARYADANGYAFETVSLANAPVGVQPAPKLFGSLDAPHLTVGGQATARVTVKKPPQRSGDFDVRLVTPAGVDASPDRVALHFDEAGKAVAEFHLRNRRMLVGTTLNVFAFVSGDDAGFPQIDTIRGSIRVAAAAARVTVPMFYQSAVALLLLLVLLEGYAWASGRSLSATQ